MRPPAPSDGVTVVLADDHAATRAGVRMALEGRGFTIVGEAATAYDAVAQALRHRPVVCLLDLSMPGGGISAAHRIGDELPDTTIVILTVSPNEDDLFEALLAGASGYLLKDTPAAKLAQALHGVLAGEAAVPRRLERRLIEEFRATVREAQSRRRFTPRGRRAHGELTVREWEVAERISEGDPTTVVAQRLGISDVTVRRHISSVMRKLDVTDRQSAVRLLRDELSGRRDAHR
jgi:DNA-binding NarL/FixJ family response regulator